MVKALLSLLLLTSLSCQSQKVNPIYKQLEEIKGKVILFGHQDDLAYGIGWEYVEGESDVKRVAGDYPALFGWELGGLELDRSHNLDSVPFDQMRSLATKVYKMGGINTFSWHPYSAVNEESSWDKEAVVVKHIIPGGAHHEEFIKQLDKVASFFKSIKDDDGNQIAFIFRPWHEMDGNWFWWGNERCTKQEFKTLFSFTVSYLRNEKELDHMLVAYSPDRNFNSSEEYYQWYPGDQYIDILGVDNYWDLKQENGELDAIKKLHIGLGVGIVIGIKGRHEAGIGHLAKVFVEVVQYFGGIGRRAGIGAKKGAGHGHQNRRGCAVPLGIGDEKTPAVVG